MDDHNPKKSRALIITIVAVVVLVVAAYFIFKNGNQLFGTKNSENITKTFSPLLGSSKAKDLNALNNSQTTNNTSSTSTIGGQNSNSIAAGNNSSASGSLNSGNLNSSGSFGQSGTFGSTGSFANNNNFNAITPQFNPIPPPGSWGLTNTGTTGTGGTVGGGPSGPPVPAPAPTKICQIDDPLVFTESEKKQLDDLLQQYYLIAPSLKTEDDVTLVDNDIISNQSLIDQATELTTQCLAQKADPGYTGPQTVKDNPYYSDPNTTPGAFYLPNFSDLEQAINIW